MPEYKQVTLKDPKTGDYLVPRVYGTLGYQIVEGQTISPLQPIDSIPSGIITLWSGASDAVPTGWALCDGQNGTPDLRNRFIVGAGSTYAVGATGGSNTVTLTTAQMPSHTHNASLSLSNLTTNSSGNHVHSGDITINAGSGAAAISGSATRYFVAEIPEGPTIALDAEITTSSAGAHTHTISGSGTVSISHTGSNSSHENRPPYYALCYIMKL